ncbi:hypothetical protein [Streptomyces pluripotens]|uniref:hypothetical protein n=1 Tax=Streptomyces pluripotens TaxID=1355015 RepID=UPI00131AC570|nr:hypothetical protein [Streptomyces pluripotens]
MTKRKTSSKRPERRYVVHGVRREMPDLRKLSKALLAVVLAEQQRTADAVEPEEGVRG